MASRCVSPGDKIVKEKLKKRNTVAWTYYLKSGKKKLVNILVVFDVIFYSYFLVIRHDFCLL